MLKNAKKVLDFKRLVKHSRKVSQFILLDTINFENYFYLMYKECPIKVQLFVLTKLLSMKLELLIMWNEPNILCFFEHYCMHN